MEEMKFLVNKIKTKNIIYNVVDNSFNASDSVLELIENGWDEKTKLMDEAGNFYYNGPLVRFESLEEKDDKTIINISNSIFYKDVIGLRYWDEKLFINYEKQELPNALSIYNFVITKDNKLIIKYRGDVGDWENVLEVPGGFVLRGEKNPFESSLKRLFEDLKLDEASVESQDLLQITDHKSITETPMMMQVKLNLNSCEIDTSNIEELFLVDNNFESIDKLKEIYDKFHLPSQISLRRYKELLKKKEKIIL